MSIYLKKIIGLVGIAVLLLALTLSLCFCKKSDKNPPAGDDGNHQTGGDNTEKPEYGENTEKPEDGENTENPEDGENTENPEGGNTENPEGGNTENPEGGNTENPEGGNTENPEGGESGGNTEVDPENPGKPALLTYEEYIAMTPEQQQSYYLSFENYVDFFNWYNEAKAKYDEENKPPEIDGDIDIGDIVGGN